MFSQEKKQQLSAAISAKGALRPCERCGTQSFIILDGYFRSEPQADLRNINLGGSSVPSIGMACNNCGSLSFFALGVVAPNELQGL